MTQLSCIQDLPYLDGLLHALVYANLCAGYYMMVWWYAAPQYKWVRPTVLTRRPAPGYQSTTLRKIGLAHATDHLFKEVYQIPSYDTITTDLLHDRNKGRPNYDRRIVGSGLWDGERMNGFWDVLNIFDSAQPPKISKVEFELITMTRLLTSQVSCFALPHGQCFDTGRAERPETRRPSEVGIT